MTTPPPLPPHRRRRRWTTWALALLIFLGGFLCGTGLTVVAVVHRVRHAIQHPEETPDRLVALLRRRLELTPAQTESVRQTIQQHQKQLQSIRRDVYPRVHAELDAIHADVSKDLNDRQREKWDRLYNETVDNWFPPPPPPPATTD